VSRVRLARDSPYRSRRAGLTDAARPTARRDRDLAIPQCDAAADDGVDAKGTEQNALAERVLAGEAE
jgi:hypothetical protein